MAQRRFGPIQGAGVSVTELEGDKIIQPAPTGITCYYGKLLKGDVGELIAAPTKSEFFKKCGTYVDGSEVPNCAFDFYNFSSGRGELYLVRLTDGTEVSGVTTFFSRHLGHGLFAGPLVDGSWSETKRALATVTAKNGGRWGGRARVLTGAVAAEATDITATTLDTALTMLVNEWAGATLRLRGVTTKTYEVISNTTAGVVTVASDQDMANDLLLGGDATNDEYNLVLDNEVLSFPTQVAGTRRAVSVVYTDGEENETSLFGLEVYEDEAKVASYPNLSLDPASKWYAPNVINEDTSNHWIIFTVLFSGTITSDMRPADWYGAANAWASDTMTAQIVNVASFNAASADAGWVDSFTTFGTARVKKQKITITFSDATNFTCATTAADGAEIVYAAGVMSATPAGSATIAAPNRYGVGFTVRGGTTAFALADTIVLDVNPFPVDEDGTGLLAGGYLYPDVGSDSRSKVLIKSNTSTTITVASAPDPTPSAHGAAVTPIDTGPLVFPLTPTTDDIEVQHSGFGTFTVSVAAGPHGSAAIFAAAINTAWQAASSSSGDIASDGGADNVELVVDDSGADLNLGYESFLIITTTNADMGLTANDIAAGTLGAEYRVEAPAELRDGYDGGALTDAHYLAAVADPSTSMLARFFGQSKGLVKVATPGVTATAVQSAFLSHVEAFSYQYRVEIPSATLDDSAAVAYINDTIGRNDFGKTTFPSYAYVPNPQGNGTVLKSLTGAIHGREALVAGSYGGYHKVGAGLEVSLPNVVRLPTGARVLNEEVLNPKGINRVVKKKGNYVLWGARTIALDPAWNFAQQRETMSHYERQFLEEFEFIIFAINDSASQDILITALTAFFLPEWQKRAVRGDSFQDAVLIKIDNENNTNLTRAAGDLNATIKLRLADTVERFNISIGKAGVFESLA